MPFERDNVEASLSKQPVSRQAQPSSVAGDLLLSFYREQFRLHLGIDSESTEGRFPAALRKWKETFFERAMAQGLPSRKDENYHYFRLRALEPIAQSEKGTDGDAQVAALDLAADQSAVHVVLLNGSLVKLVGPSETEPAQTAQDPTWSVEPLTMAAVETELATQAQDSKPLSFFQSLELAFLEHGLILHFKASAEPLPPVRIHQCYDPLQTVFCASRVRISLDAGAEADVTIRAYGSDAVGGLQTLESLEAVLEGESRLRLVSAFDRSLSLSRMHRQAFTLQKASQLESFNLFAAHRLIRNDIRAWLKEPGAHCSLLGMALGDGEGASDQLTEIYHQASDTTCSQYYKNATGGSARASLNGRIIVEPGISGIDAKQLSRSLLLSNSAESSVKPELQIHADDVKCSHGATIASLDPDQLFYLESRGIDAERAKALLVRAFALEFIDRASAGAMREQVRAILAAQTEAFQP